MKQFSSKKKLVMFVLLLIVGVFVLGACSATSDQETCQPMGLKGIGQFEGSLYTQTWGGQAFRFDTRIEKWTLSSYPDHMALYGDLWLPNKVYAEVQSDGFNVFISLPVETNQTPTPSPNRYFKICN